LFVVFLLSTFIEVRRVLAKSVTQALQGERLISTVKAPGCPSLTYLIPMIIIQIILGASNNIHSMAKKYELFKLNTSEETELKGKEGGT
jgi:hypothetical protein